MKKLVLTIDGINSQAEGVGRIEGKVCFVPLTVVGDEVEVEVIQDHKTYFQARLINIIKASPNRVDAPCKYYGQCGGCQLQHVDYKEQLNLKQNMVMQALARLGGQDVLVETILGSPQVWNYRNRIQLHQNKKGEWGFYKTQTHDVIVIDQCLIANHELNNQIKSQDLKLPRKIKTTELRVDESKGFMQVNSSQNQQLIDLVMNALNPKPQDVVADLYCGAGNFAIPLALRVNQVIGIEKSRDAIEAGIKRAKKEGISNIQWRQSEVKTWVKQCLNDQKIPNALVIDPPRAGMSDVLPDLARLQVPQIVFVSCDPATFARDAKALIEAGYTLKRVWPLDMFPHTSHIELVGLFVRRQDAQ